MDYLPTKGVNYVSLYVASYKSAMAHQLFPADRHLLDKEYEPKLVHRNESHYNWLQKYHTALKAWHGMLKQIKTLIGLME